MRTWYSCGMTCGRCVQHWNKTDYAHWSGLNFCSSLASELESHCCPICFELMMGPANAPMLLSPCGHTFCAKVCLRQKMLQVMRIENNTSALCKQCLIKVFHKHANDWFQCSVWQFMFAEAAQEPHVHVVDKKLYLRLWIYLFKS